LHTTVGVDLLNVLERNRSFFLAVAIIGTIGLFVPDMLDMFERPPGAVEASRAASSLHLGVGDCIADPGLGHFIRSTTSCDDEDALEVFHTFDVAADAYPGELDLSDLARRVCMDAFETVGGDPPRDPRPRLASATPTSETWETAADRQVLCLLVRSS
jgi:hypothetical protein